MVCLIRRIADGDWNYNHGQISGREEMLESSLKYVSLTTAENQENQHYSTGDHDEVTDKGNWILSYT